MKKTLPLLILLLTISCLVSAQSTILVSGVIDGGSGSSRLRLYPAAIPVVVPRPAEQKAQPDAITDLGSGESLRADAFPNPAAGRLHLHLQTPGSGRLEIDIADLTGRRVYSADYAVSTVFDTQINTAAYPAGVYLVTFAFVNSTGAKQPPLTRKIQLLSAL